MTNTEKFQTPAPSALQVARARIGILFEEFMAATGLPKTFVVRFAVGDPKFGKSYLERDFLLGTYDRINSRISAAWPSDVDWPEDVPRQKSAELEPSALEELDRRLGAKQKSEQTT